MGHQPVNADLWGLCKNKLMLMRILLFIIFILSTATIKAQCNYEKDTLKCWMVALVKPGYKTVKVIECKQILEFDRLCKGLVLGYLTLFNRPMVMDDFYILHISNTKIRL